jgi:hypothetical protein
VKITDLTRPTFEGKTTINWGNRTVTVSDMFDEGTSEEHPIVVDSSNNINSINDNTRNQRSDSNVSTNDNDKYRKENNNKMIELKQHDLKKKLIGTLNKEFQEKLAFFRVVKTRKNYYGPFPEKVRIGTEVCDVDVPDSFSQSTVCLMMIHLFINVIQIDRVHGESAGFNTYRITFALIKDAKETNRKNTFFKNNTFFYQRLKRKDGKEEEGDEDDDDHDHDDD